MKSLDVKTAKLKKKLQKRQKKKVSVLGVDTLWGDCMAVLADLLVIFTDLCWKLGEFSKSRVFLKEYLTKSVDT